MVNARNLARASVILNLDGGEDLLDMRAIMRGYKANQFL